MACYKLYSFTHSPRADLARLILSYAGVEFIDHRFSRSDWSQYEHKIPFGALPAPTGTRFALEFEGKMLAQTFTIFRFLARRHGLAGKGEWEQALVEMYGDSVNELWAEAVRVFLDKDPERKKEMWPKYISDQVVPHLKIIEKQLEENGSGFIVGSEMTWVDLAYYEHFTFLPGCEEIVQASTKFKELIERIAAIPSVQKWEGTRVKVGN